MIRGGVFRHKPARHQRMAFLSIFLDSEGSGNPSVVFRGIESDSEEVRIVENKAVVVEHCHSLLTTFFDHFPNSIADGRSRLSTLFTTPSVPFNVTVASVGKIRIETGE